MKIYSTEKNKYRSSKQVFSSNDLESTGTFTPAVDEDIDEKHEHLKNIAWLANAIPHLNAENAKKVRDIVFSMVSALNLEEPQRAGEGATNWTFDGISDTAPALSTNFSDTSSDTPLSKAELETPGRLLWVERQKLEVEIGRKPTPADFVVAIYGERFGQGFTKHHLRMADSALHRAFYRAGGEATFSNEISFDLAQRPSQTGTWALSNDITAEQREKRRQRWREKNRQKSKKLDVT